MSAPPRRALTIDDPVAGQEPCHVAHPPPGLNDGRIAQIAVQDICPNPDQPRKRFDETALAALTDSIAERGVLQPVIVRPLSAGRFELVAGERRWRAAQLAGRTTIPALINDTLDAAGSLELALIENVAREDLTPIEEARTIATLLGDLNVTATRLAKGLGRSRTDLAHTVRLLDLPDQTIELIDNGELTKGHGKALLTEPDHHRRRLLARQAADAGWSIRALESAIARQDTLRQPTREPHPDHQAAAAKLEDAITKATGCDARARPHRHGYQLILDQAAAEKLASLLDGVENRT
ncbi:MAG: ParB/RepB/Spo0J family partition protein [Solirubrobacteraceae bacterium]